MQKRKKRHFKKWVLYSIYIICLVLFFIISDKLGLIQASNNAVDITNLIIIITAWEVLKVSMKACYNREKKTC